VASPTRFLSAGDGGSRYRPWLAGYSPATASPATALLAVLGCALLRPHAGLVSAPTPGCTRRAQQTPREFTEAVRRFLNASPSTAPVAGIPARLAALLYRVRYGEQPLTEEE